MTPQDALLASSPPRSGHKPKKRETPRACPLSENPFFDARTGTLLGPPAAGFVYSHGAAYAQEYRLRLKRTTPIQQGGRCPPFKSSTVRRRPDALAPSPLCAVFKRKLTF